MRLMLFAFLLLAGAATAQGIDPARLGQVYQQQRNLAYDNVAQCAVSISELQTKIAELEKKLAEATKEKAE